MRRPALMEAMEVSRRFFAERVVGPSEFGLGDEVFAQLLVRRVIEPVLCLFFTATRRSRDHYWHRAKKLEEAHRYIAESKSQDYADKLLRYLLDDAA